MIRFNGPFWVLAVIAAGGGILLFVPEGIALQAVALALPVGLAGDIFAWALLLIDMWIVGHIAYRAGFKRYVHPPNGKNDSLEQRV